MTNLGGNQSIVVCVYAGHRPIAAVALPPLCCIAGVAVLVAATVIVVVATAVADVAAAS